jgi:hypothetical protein
MLQAILRTSYHYIQAFLCAAVLYLGATFHPSCNCPGWLQQDFQELLPWQDLSRLCAPGQIGRPRKMSAPKVRPGRPHRGIRPRQADGAKCSGRSQIFLDQERSSLARGPFDRQKVGAARRWQLFDHIFPACDKRTKRAFMGIAIDAARQTADDYQASIGEVPCQLLHHLIPAGGRTTRADDGNQAAVQKFNFSKSIQEGRGS